MDLKKRLAQFDRLSRPRPTTAGSPARSGGLSNLALADAACRSLGLHQEDTAWGPVRIREHHTRRPALPARGIPGLNEVFTGKAQGELAADQLLFLDTETTGLAGGTGSLAFLVGLGWWSAGGFQVRQYFLTGPGLETPILRQLAELSRSFRAVVTYNGNGFDLPLLRTRALLARCPDPMASLTSLDLLPAARRLWGRRLQDCRQQTLEEVVCDRPRGAGDIDGAQIPQAYFSFLQDGEAGLLTRVLRHNLRDVQGMAYLLRAVLTRLRGLSRVTQAARANLPWQDAWANGRICEKRGERDLAAAWLDTALTRLNAGNPRTEQPELFYRDAIRILKRTAAWNRVEEVIHKGLRACGDKPWLHREAAILYEHRLDRLGAAWQHARHCGEQQRLRRIKRKLARLPARVV